MAERLTQVCTDVKAHATTAHSQAMDAEGPLAGLSYLKAMSDYLLESDKAERVHQHETMMMHSMQSCASAAQCRGHLITVVHF